MNKPDHNLNDRLETFLQEIPVTAIAERVARNTGKGTGEIRELLDTYINEARVALNLVESRLAFDMPILEVGAGLCLLSLFLRREGYDITALEPAIGGYGLFEQSKNAILEHFADIPLDVILCPAQELAPGQHGTFALIFSNNVIEHIPDWRGALTAMAGVLLQDGCMLHACPNYSFPYEPHYGVPVIRRLPALSKRLFLPAGADDEIWNSLNFIAARQVRQFGAGAGLSIRLMPGLLEKAFRRFEDDPLFSERHGSALAGVGRFINRSGLGWLIGKIPPNWVTPMIVELRPAAQAHRGN